MNPDNIKASIQAIIDGLAPLAKQSQIPLEELWSWAIKHNYALAVVDLVVGVLLLGSWIYCFRQFLKARKKDPYSDGSLISRLTTLSGIFGLIAAFFCIGEAIMRLIGPGWSTAEDIG